ncbi:class I SAM-dependent methyltransferase [Actinomadura litoris]|uniref:class I SAM-dependent methyltransferase n=1 Tax=Actinomadura litoris TaxID=2678616 RepID=UPI001FA72941|nr:class I SAM-dependent methyltransferase [Actinomadura litoris]
MPTQPSEQPPSSVPEPHRHRNVAESFGVDAERYDRTRPRYPDALVERIVAASPGPDVVDVGCGTGIEARQLRAAGCAVLGIEPDARMAGFARRAGFEVEVATFEAWEDAGRRFDAVVAGQSWHWVEPVAGAAKAARVLRPGGLLAVFWHVFQMPDEVFDAFAEVYRRVAPDSPIPVQSAKQPLNLYEGMFARTSDGIRAADAFGEPEHWRHEWEKRYTRDEWLDQIPTHGSLTRLPPDKLAEVLESVGAAIDRLGGGFTVPYVTVAVTASRPA